MKLFEHKDNNVFKGLADLADVGLELPAAAPLIKSLVQVACTHACLAVC